MAANGATSSLPVALAKGCSQSTLPTFVIARCRSAVCGVHDLRPGKPPEGELDGGEGREGGQSFRKVLEVLGEAAISPEPGESATKPFMSSLRLTTSMRSTGTLATAAATCPVLFESLPIEPLH